jgi:PH domain
LFKHFENKNQKLNLKAYAELRQKCLLIYKKKESSSKSQGMDLPFKIIYLEGLYIDNLPSDAKGNYGFTISHKNPNYGVYHFEFDQKSEYDRWNEHISKQMKLLQDDFILTEEIIGRGRFSVVHKGFSKKKKEISVAIKIIERAELKKEEEEILK